MPMGVSTVMMWAALAWIAWEMYKSRMSGMHAIAMWAMFGGMVLMVWLMGAGTGLGAVAMWAMVIGMALMVERAREAARRFVRQAGSRFVASGAESERQMPDRTTPTTRRHTPAYRRTNLTALRPQRNRRFR